MPTESPKKSIKTTWPPYSKGAYPKGFITSLNATIKGPSEGSQDMEDVSKMKNAKLKQNPEEVALAKFKKTLKEALESIEQRVRIKALKAALFDHIRTEINNRMPDLSPADVERFSSEAASQVSYTLGEIKVLPEALKHYISEGVAQNTGHAPYTNEPTASTDCDD